MSTRRSNIKFQPDHPSLFDTPAPRLPFDNNDTEAHMPVHPAIKRHVARIAMESRRPTGSSDLQASGATTDVVLPAVQKPMMFMSFGSGSSGNCSYIGNRSHGFLVDAGVNPLHVEQSLLHNAITMDSIAGIILTHDHSDHIQYAYTLLRKYKHMRLYCTPKALGGILRRHNISRRIRDYHVGIYKEFPFKLGPFEITAFDVLHDGTDNAGFFVSYRQDSTHQTLTIATDLGCISDRVRYYMQQSQQIVIESNYDEEMLRTGRYTERLKDRIRSDHGHLSNDEAARFISSIYSPMLQSIFLCHLSHDNNTPEKALEATSSALASIGVATTDSVSPLLPTDKPTVRLVALPRFDITRLYAFMHSAKEPPES